MTHSDTTYQFRTQNGDTVELTDEELGLLLEGLDSHVYWELSQDDAGAIVECLALEEKLRHVQADGGGVMDGIDRYEAQEIARTEARAVADEIRRDLEYDDIAQIRRELESIARAMNQSHAELWDANAEVRAGLGSLDSETSALLENIDKRLRALEH